jgi:hypothetical protein
VITRRAFEMFERNENRARVAMELGEPVENVNWLYEQYLVMSGKMSAEQARRAVQGGPPTPEPRRNAVRAREVDPRDLAARRHTLDPVDRELLQWIEKSDAQKKVYEERRQAVVAERSAATAPGHVPIEVNDEEIAARPREMLTDAERSYREILDVLQAEEVARQTTRIAG